MNMRKYINLSEMWEEEGGDTPQEAFESQGLMMKWDDQVASREQDNFHSVLFEFDGGLYATVLNFNGNKWVVVDESVGPFSSIEDFKGEHLGPVW